MNITTFDLERNQSLFENQVTCNLTESGLHAHSLADVLNPDELAEVGHLSLGYGHTDGDPDLKAAIAALYPGRTSANVIVTNGSAEANFITMWSLLEPGDEIIYMVPNYLQIAGIARALGVVVREWPLREDHDWRPDLDALEAMMSERTRLIVVCHPNNPTGAVLPEADMRRIAQIAAAYDCPVHSDEIYRGSELNAMECPSFAQVYDRSIVVSGLSKALGFPGLRIGWLVAPESVALECRRRHDYTSICASIISQYAAIRILQPRHRNRLLAEGQAHLRHNLEQLQRWLSDMQGVCGADSLSLTPPMAGGMAFVRYRSDIPSNDLVDRLRLEHDVFLVAGSWFGMEGFVRIGIGVQADILADGLRRITPALQALLTLSPLKSD